MFSGSTRFQIVRRLGSGGMGEVFECLDREHDARIALKVLRRVDARLLYRFKREFRAMQELAHPNLASLLELHEEGGLWFFTMELIEGADILRAIWGLQDETIAYAHTAHGGRAAPGPTGPMAAVAHGYDETLLRDSMRQLCEALRFLHAAGKVHRDVKPSNVLVTPAGRTVLLDFGLVTDADPDLQSSDGDIVGTPAYMAPEQAAGRAVEPAADMYAVGVLLFEALTGRLPFSGSPAEILLRKQTAHPPEPAAFGGDVPPDLARLATRLLDAEPARRPTAAEALEHLCGRASIRVPAATRAPIFLGRDRELALLRDALREVIATRRPRVVHVEADSGVGKSALVAQHLAWLRSERDDLLELSGRCYERENTHYRAFDGVVDAMVRRLWSLSDGEVARLTPGDASFLTRMFPMFDGVRAFAGALRSVTTDHDARRRAYAALRELLHRFARRSTIVISIDDVQWTDGDSLRLLGELLRGPDAPPVLYVLASRPTGEPGWLRHGLGVEVTPVALAPLEPALAEELADALLGDAGADRAAAAAIAHEAAGHPLHIAELARHAAGSARGARRPRLDEAILDRLGRLPLAAQQICALLALAGAPLEVATLRRAADVAPLEFQRALAALRLGHLARRSGGDDDERVEPYHDRVREAVAGALDDDRRRDLHARLAAAMTTAGAPPELLLPHLVGAGLDERAAQTAIDAAQRASAAMAYDRAAELYRAALRHGRWTGDRLRDVRLRLGDELINAGRGRDAAEVLADVAGDAGPDTRLECRRKAAEQLLICGYIPEGLAAVAVLLDEVETHMPPSPRCALISLLYHRAAVALRGRRRWTPRREAQVPAEVLSRLDVYKAVSHGLSMVDNIRGADFNARYLRLALRTGEPVRLCRALGTEAIFLGSQGGRGIARARALVDEVARLAGQVSSPYARAWAAGSGGCLEYFSGRWFAAEAALARSEDLFREERITEGYELNNLRMFRSFSLTLAGAVRALRPRYDEWLADAQQRGDRYTETVLRLRCGILWLHEGDLDGAGAALADLRWAPPGEVFHLQHWYEIQARAELALCARQVAGHADAVDAGIAKLRSSKLIRVQTVRLAAAWLSARLHLLEGRDPAAAARRARKAVRALLDGPPPYAVKAHLLAATERTVARDDAGAEAAYRAAIAAAGDDTRLYAAIAHHRLGEHSRAAELTADLGIASVAALADVMAPELG